MDGDGAMAVPVPERTPTSAPFWEGLERDELVLQHCAHCGAWIYYPRVRCSRCLASELVWEPVDARGTLHAFTVTRRPTAPMFAADMPQLIAIVELPIGVRITTTLVTDDPDSLRVGMPAVGVFDHGSDGTTLLRFRPEG